MLGGQARRSLSARIVFGSSCLPAAKAAEPIRVETTAEEVISLILGAQARAGKQQVLPWEQGSRDLNARGPGLTLSGVHLFLLFHVSSRGLMLSKLLPKHEGAPLTAQQWMSPMALSASVTHAFSPQDCSRHSEDPVFGLPPHLVWCLAHHTDQIIRDLCGTQG